MASKSMTPGSGETQSNSTLLHTLVHINTLHSVHSLLDGLKVDDTRLWLDARPLKGEAERVAAQLVGELNVLLIPGGRGKHEWK